RFEVKAAQVKALLLPWASEDRPAAALVDPQMVVLQLQDGQVKHRGPQRAGMDAGKVPIAGLLAEDVGEGDCPVLAPGEALCGPRVRKQLLVTVIGEAVKRLGVVVVRVLVGMAQPLDRQPQARPAEHQSSLDRWGIVLVASNGTGDARGGQYRNALATDTVERTAHNSPDAVRRVVQVLPAAHERVHRNPDAGKASSP